MRLSIKTPIILLLVAAGLFLTAKGVMYLRVKALMDDLAEQASTEAEITYSSISTDLTGGATVEGIRIRPLQIEQAIEIQQASFASDDPMILLTGADWRSADSPPPDQLSFSLRGITIALDDQFVRLLREQAESQAALSGKPADSCDQGVDMDPTLLTQLGFQQLSMDMDMEYEFDVPEESLNARMHFDIHGLETVEMEVTLEGIVPQDVQQQRASMPTLSNARMAVQVNREFGDRLMQLCAERSKLDVNTYREELVTRMFDDLAQVGVSFGTGLQQAMKDFYREWGEVRVTLRPQNPLGPLQMMTINPQNLVDVLGLTLRVNDRPVHDLSFDFDIQQLMQRGGFAQPEGGSNLPSPPLPERVRLIRRFEPVAVAGLDQHMGALVRIQPRSQPLREGVLVAIADGEVQIERRTHGGSVTSYVGLQDIDSAQVQVVERQRLK